MVLTLLKLLSHLRQFLSYLLLLLLQVNYVQSAIILFDLVFFFDPPYHNEDGSCASFCYLSAICSDFTILRRPTRARALSTQFWRCHPHSSVTTGESPLIQQHTSSVRLTLLSLNSFLSQDMSLSDAKSFKEKWAKCSVVLHSNTVPVRCI